MLQHATGQGSATETLEETRSAPSSSGRRPSTWPGRACALSAASQHSRGEGCGCTGTGWCGASSEVPHSSADYLRHRLQLAVVERELFPLDTIALLHEASQGTHRELDRLASLCLREAARRTRKLVERDVARSVLDRQVSSSS
jgi:hypothetical protein